LAGTLLPFLFLPSSFCLLPSIPPALIAIPWTGLLIAGHFYASLPLSAGLLAILSLLSFALPQIPKPRSLPPGRLFSFPSLWLILFLAIAIYQTDRSGPAF